jgi:hypothetical protein
VGIAEMIAEEFDDGVFKVVFGECHGVFHLCGRYFGDFVKYDIVGGMREKGYGGGEEINLTNLLNILWF